MPQTEHIDTGTGKTRSHWLNTRRLEFWILWPVLLFFVIGSAVTPLLAKKLLTNQLNENFNVQAHVADIDINPFTLGFTVEGFTLDDAQGVRLVAIEQLFADFRASGFFTRTLVLEDLQISGVSAHFIQHPQGDSNFSRAFRARQQQEDAAENSKPWGMAVTRFNLEGRNIVYLDERTAEPAELEVTHLELSLQNFSNAPGSTSPMNLALELGSGGTIAMDGELGLFPEFVLAANLDINDLSMLPAQAYVADIASIDVESGKLDLSGQLSTSSEEPLGFVGTTAVKNLQLTDSQRGQHFAGWALFGIDEIAFSAGDGTLELSQLNIREPYGRVDIAADQSTNIGRIFSSSNQPPDTDEPGQEETPAKPLQVIIGQVQLEDGSANFSDASLPLTFATEIHRLNGNISAFATGSTEPARVSLEGQVDEYGLARIEGAVNLMAPTEHSDLEVIFNNLELQSLSPYTVAFAGRHIDAGKLDLELDYQLSNDQMKGENNIVIRDIVLGDKVDHPGAMDLPLDLAIALLKGANGEIDIDLPVSGDLNDPEFSYGGVVLKALGGLIVKVVASPFRLLGRLIGDDSEDFGKIGFLPGQAGLTPPELEKAHKLAEVLKMRPQLEVVVQGVIDPEADKQALQATSLEALLSQELEELDTSATDAMLVEQTRLAVESLYQALPDSAPLAQLQQQFSSTSEADGTTQLDELAYVAAMKDQLRLAQPITASQLEALAAGRANAIIEAIREQLPSEPKRVTAGTSSEVKASDGDWIATELELAAGNGK